MARFSLVTKHNTYLAVTNEYVHPLRLQGHFQHRWFPPLKKISLLDRNRRIIQIGHSTIWETFITLTFSPEYYWEDIQKIQKQFRAFLEKLRYHKINMKYLAVLEYGEENGRIHYHMLTTIPFSSTIFYHAHHPTRKCCQFWDFGWSDVVAVNNENCSAVFYLAKYLTKDSKNRTPIGKREVFSSRGLNNITKTIVRGNIVAVKGYKEFATKGKTTIYIKQKISI